MREASGPARSNVGQIDQLAAMIAREAQRAGLPEVTGQDDQCERCRAKGRIALILAKLAVTGRPSDQKGLLDRSVETRAHLQTETCRSRSRRAAVWPFGW